MFLCDRDIAEDWCEIEEVYIYRYFYSLELVWLGLYSATKNSVWALNKMSYSSTVLHVYESVYKPVV